jgi:hypothetical protein
MDIDENLYSKLANLLAEHEAPKRKALSSKYPLLKKPILDFKHNFRTISNLLDPKLRCYQSKDNLPMIVARHQSVLRRRLGDSDLELQEQ